MVLPHPAVILYDKKMQISMHKALTSSVDPEDKVCGFLPLSKLGSVDKPGAGLRMMLLARSIVVT